MLKEIIKKYNSYCKEEFGNEPVSENTTTGTLGLMYTSVGENEEYDVQVSYDLDNQEIICELYDKETGKTETYKQKETYEEFLEELDFASFQDYYSWAHDVVEREFGREDIEF